MILGHEWWEAWAVISKVASQNQVEKQFCKQESWWLKVWTEWEQVGGSQNFPAVLCSQILKVNCKGTGWGFLLFWIWVELVLVRRTTLPIPCFAGWHFIIGKYRQVRSSLSCVKRKAECEGGLWEKKLQDSRNQKQSSGAYGLEMIFLQGMVSLVPALRRHNQEGYYKLQISAVHAVKSRPGRGHSEILSQTQNSKKKNKAFSQAPLEGIGLGSIMLGGVS